MQKIIIAAVAAVVMLGILMPAYLIIKQGKHNAIALSTKGLCTLTAVLLGLVGALYNGTTVSWCITAGLFICAIGDVAIGIQFIVGVFAFLIGHLCYITAFLSAASYSPWSAAVFFLTALLIAILFYKQLDKMGNARIPLFFYTAVISAMLSLAVLLPFSCGPRGLIPAAGASLFVLSDLLLARNMFIRSTRFSDGFSLGCYYAGQYLLALSVFL